MFADLVGVHNLLLCIRLHLDGILGCLKVVYEGHQLHDDIPLCAVSQRQLLPSLSVMVVSSLTMFVTLNISGSTKYILSLILQNTL